MIIFRMKLASLGKSSAFESSADAEYYNNMKKAKRKIETQSLTIVGSDRKKKWIYYHMKKSQHNSGHVRLRSIRNKKNWNNVSKRLVGSYSHS